MNLGTKLFVKSFYLLVAMSPLASAHDLVLQDTKVIKVSPCDRQIRLTVRHDGAGHQHLAGKSASGAYSISVISLNRKKKILDFEVAEHDQGETLYFVVPSTKLVCDSSVKIVVDAGNTVAETNENNNSAIEKLVRPKSQGLIETCPVDPAQCS